MKKRAASQARTRTRIVEAAMELHGEVGPRETTISAVADRAGVQRLTVYRHFPDERSLFRACSSHWLGLNPPPDPARWQALADAGERTDAALKALYAYYRRTASMWSLVYRDRDQVAAMEEPLQEFEVYRDDIRDDLLAAWRPKGRRPAILAATLKHALSFATWESMARQSLSDSQIRSASAQWIAAVAAGSAAQNSALTTHE